MWVIAKKWDFVSQAEPHPIGDVSGRVAATSQAVAGLVHQQCMGLVEMAERWSPPWEVCK
jgi:hypothetical protein